MQSDISDYVLVKDLAEELGVDRSVLRRWILRRGFEPIKVRAPGTAGQLALALSWEEADEVREQRLREYDIDDEGEISFLDDGLGWFYIIQIVPELEEGRVKLGFTNDVNARLVAHKTVVPTAEVLRTWPCNRKWEYAVIESVTRTGCTVLSREVFIFHNLEDLIKNCEAFFSIMPEVIIK